MREEVDAEQQARQEEGKAPADPLQAPTVGMAVMVK